KHIYYIYKKMVKKKLTFDGLFDIRAVRILVDTIPECYTTLGIVHSLWQPIPGEFDDYIANPKGNGYKSLHTVIVGPEDKGVEVQIRTFDMHQFNEFGVAAHWRYKEGGKGDSAYEQKIAWLRQLLDWRENMAESGKEDLAAAFKTELFNDTIYVLTPHGKVLSLPTGATPIDFAYALHSSVGDRCRGAKVEGQIVPLSTPLENGQRVEIITAKEGNPSVNWLYEGWVKSNRAISKIRAYIRQQNADTVREEGRAQLDKQLSKIFPKPNLQALAEKLGFKKTDELYTAIGQGEVSNRAIHKACGALNEPPPVPIDETNIVKQSKITNWDLRFEWYPSLGEVVSLSLFHKKFKDPAEVYTWLRQDGHNYDEIHANLPEATAKGIELNVRKSLGFLLPGSFLRDLWFTGNFSIIDGTVKLNYDESIQNSYKNRRRPLMGMSPYTVNAGLGYFGKKFSATVN
ncbi:MAG: TonB-dependent receptor, partial [Neisseria sp.]|nr:TonB-dependent receptor [Neisseria sp.]